MCPCIQRPPQDFTGTTGIVILRVTMIRTDRSMPRSHLSSAGRTRICLHFYISETAYGMGKKYICRSEDYSIQRRVGKQCLSSA